MAMEKSKQASLPVSEDISHQLELILSSPDFKATPQQIALLKYVVGKTLAGNVDYIKGYTIATEVFGRSVDFDQNTDPIVSIQAARLRQALNRYYQGGGKNDPLRIDIPKGSYVPVFTMRTQPLATVVGADTPEPPVQAKAGRYWPTVLVQSVQNVSSDPALDTFGIGMGAELADELNRYPDIRVMTRASSHRQTTDDQISPSFVINGSVRSDSEFIKLIVTLIDARSNRQIWSSSCRSELGNGSIIAFQERAARMLAVEVAGKRGRIAVTVSREFQNGGPPGSEAYEAVLRYYEYLSSVTPDAFQRALTALEKATTTDPECGQAWSVRGRLYAFMHAFEIPGFDRPLDQARAFGLKGLRLRPDDQRSHGTMAFIHLMRNEMTAGRREVDKALQLGPESLFILDDLGYLLTHMGEWERGPELIEKSIRRNPFYSNYVHYALWLNRIRLGDYERAYQETMQFNRPADFWDPLTKSATLGLLGRIEDGRRSATELLRRKPDFRENGRRLIGHFIKFDFIADQVIEGLGAVGVTV